MESLKIGVMLNGMVQMLDYVGQDESVTLRIKDDNGVINDYPLVRVHGGTSIDGIILTNMEKEDG